MASYVSKDDGEASGHVTSEDADADLVQTWKDLQKGEKTAQMLESNLTNLEKKIDDLLASFEESERQKVEGAQGQSKEGDGSPNKA